MCGDVARSIFDQRFLVTGNELMAQRELGFIVKNDIEEKNLPKSSSSNSHAY
jgi:hypothetical protein